MPAGVAYLKASTCSTIRNWSTATTSSRWTIRKWAYGSMTSSASNCPSHRRSSHSAAPLLGQHTELVLKHFLGCSEAEYQALVDAGALQ